MINGNADQSSCRTARQDLENSTATTAPADTRAWGFHAQPPATGREPLTGTADTADLRYTRTGPASTHDGPSLTGGVNTTAHTLRGGNPSVRTVCS